MNDLKKIKKTQDLTAGSPLKVMLLFLLPILIGNVAQQFYNLADTIIIGYTIGDFAFAGVGATGWLVSLVLNFSVGLLVGFSVYTAQKFGAKDEFGVRRSFAQGLMLTVIIGVIITVIACVFAKPMLTLMQTKETLMPYAFNYLIWIYAGTLITMFYNLFANMLRAIGDSRAPLWFLLVAVIINIGLDLLFITVFKMGVAGAAIATLISQAVATILSAIYMFVKYPIFRLKKADFKPDWATMKAELSIGLPMSFQNVLIAIGGICVQTALNTLGEVYNVAFVAATKLEGFAITVLVSIGSMIAVYVGQNYGARNRERIKSGIKIASVLAIVLALLFYAIFLLFSEPLVSLVAGGDSGEVDRAAMLGFASQYLKISGIAYVFLGAIVVFRNALQGIGQSKWTIPGGIIELMTRISCALLVGVLGFTGMCLNGLTTWFFTGIYCAVIFFILFKRVDFKDKVIKEIAKTMKESVGQELPVYDTVNQ